MTKHYVGETGTQLILDTGILVATAAFSYIKYNTPDGVQGTWSASAYSSYSSLASATGTYFLSHTLAQSDFRVPGVWEFQAFIGAVDGTWFGETVKYEIFDLFE